MIAIIEDLNFDSNTMLVDLNFDVIINILDIVILVNIVFSDILGDYRIIINTEMEVRLKSSDYLITYYNLSSNK